MRATKESHPEAWDAYGPFGSRHLPARRPRAPSHHTRLFGHDLIEPGHEGGVAPAPGFDQVDVSALGHRADDPVVAQLGHDLVHIREVLFERDVVLTGFDRTRILAGKHHERRAEGCGLEDPRRDHMHDHISFVFTKYRVVHFLI